MKRTYVIVAVVIVLALGGWYLFAHTIKLANDKNMAPTPSASASVAAGASVSPSVAADSSSVRIVAIQNFAFGPNAVTVKKGTRVQWVNKDSADHTITETDGQPGPDSGNLADGKSYSFTYNTAGTFHYHCAIHSSMTGTVTVTE